MLTEYPVSSHDGGGNILAAWYTIEWRGCVGAQASNGFKKLWDGAQSLCGRLSASNMFKLQVGLLYACLELLTGAKSVCLTMWIAR